MRRSTVVPVLTHGSMIGGLTGSLLLIGSMAMAATRPSLRVQSQDGLVAQLFPQQPGRSVPTAPPPGCGPQGCQLSIDKTLLASGQRVAVRYEGKDTQVLSTGEQRALALNLVDPIVNSAGRVVVPAGSEIRGDVVPIEGGGQFVAKQIVVNGRPYAFPAQSDTIHDVKDPRETSVGAIAGDAVIGAVGGAVVSQVLNGRIGVGEVIGGAAAGVVIGNVTAPRAVVISNGDQYELQMVDAFKL